jgi:hypothetical protein
MKIRCLDDVDNNLITANKDIFETFHKKNLNKYLEYDFDNVIYVPTIINICIKNKKNSIDFLKYCDYMISVLNDGFSGNIKSKYKNYSSDYFTNLLGEINGQIVQNYINYKYDTKIRFFLKSIIYHDKNFEYDFCKNKSDTEDLITNFYANGFNINDEHKYDLHINVIKFSCDTLGVSTFPWIKHILNKNIYPMLVFIDYNTVNPEISTNRFNQCRTLIHEVGHIFGLKHIFGCKKNSIDGYRVILGEKYFEKIFGNINQDEVNIKLYPDTPIQKFPTLKNPFEKNKFEIFDGIPVNFACFMDYSPDEVLTHFTKSQGLIMRNIINIYKSKLITNSSNFNINKNTTLILPIGKKINFDKNYFSLKASTDNLFYIYKIKYEDLKYNISKNYITKEKKDIVNKNIENNTLSTLNLISYIIEKL